MVPVIAAIFPPIEGSDVAIISAVMSVIGGILWRIILWSQTKGEQLIAFVKPKVEEFATSHTRLADTATEALKEMTGHVGVIKEEIKGVHTTLHGHGTILTRLNDRCQINPPKVSDA